MANNRIMPRTNMMYGLKLSMSETGKKFTTLSWNEDSGRPVPKPVDSGEHARILSADVIDPATREPRRARNLERSLPITPA